MNRVYSTRSERGSSRALVGVTLVLTFLLHSIDGRAQEWFDDYARGLEALQEGDASRAVQSFENAIWKRPEPGENLITYGTNRVDQYHPYLKLAEAHMAAKNLDEAREALDRSESWDKEPADERSRIAMRLAAVVEKANITSEPPETSADVPPAPTITVPKSISTSTTTTTSPPEAQPSQPAEVNGTLEVLTNPGEVSVLADDRFLGVTPLEVELEPGDHLLVLRKEGWKEERLSIRIVTGAKEVVTRTLTEASPTSVETPSTSESASSSVEEIASLLVFSQPPGAAVYLNDELIGITDLDSGRYARRGVSPGLHRLRLSHGDYADLVDEVLVESSGPTTYRGTLTPLEPEHEWSPRITLIALVALVILVMSIFGAWKLLRPDVKEQSISRPATSHTSFGPSHGSSDEADSVSQVTPIRPDQREWFGEYELLGVLGKGGMASVYKAERKGELYALKRPHSMIIEQPQFRDRFTREAEIGRTLHHPNIVRIFEKGEVKGVPYFTMELIQGETLHVRLKREVSLEPKVATAIVIQVAEALDYAHLKGVIHRDLKPTNIMTLGDGTAKVMDYGIARARRFEGVTVTGAFIGTPDYVSPEVAEGDKAGARSDLYSLGIIFYELLIGQRPFMGKNPLETLKKHRLEAPTPPSVLVPSCPRGLETIILRLLAKAPDDRYADAERLLIDLRDYQNRAS